MPKKRSKIEFNIIERPKHYTFGSIEVIEAIEAWGLGYHDGNIIKYVVRAKHKGKELEDLKKAKWYIERRIRLLEKILG